MRARSLIRSNQIPLISLFIEAAFLLVIFLFAYNAPENGGRNARMQRFVNFLCNSRHSQYASPRNYDFRDSL